MERLDPGAPVIGRDLRAALRRFGPRDADRSAFARAIADTDAFFTYEDLFRACPPARAGLAPGRYAALFEPLFGEFE